MTQFGFHPIIERWFASRFAGPTEPQVRGWPEIAAGRHTLISAPTGSGKTLTAFLAVIDRLFREALDGTLKEEMRVVYISPLRALSNDMQKNLSGPLEEIAQFAREAGEVIPKLRVGLRTGDTPASERAKLVKHPPHIFVTTPESLFLMLTAEKGRAALSTVDTVIVDEIHALARDKRGSHLALSLERLEHLVSRETRDEGREPDLNVGRAFQPVPSAETTTAFPVISFGRRLHAQDGLERPSYEATSGASSSTLTPNPSPEGRGEPEGIVAGLSESSESTRPVESTPRRSNRSAMKAGRTPGSEIVPAGHAGSLDSESPATLPSSHPSSLVSRPLQRIGLSATQKPIERMARFLVGAGDELDPVPSELPPRELPELDATGGCKEEVDRAGQIASREPPTPRPVNCSIIDVGHQRQLDLGVVTPESELSAVCSHELWAEINAQIVELINTHRSTVIFVNTRRMAERVTFQLTQLLGEEAVSSHHGSLSAEIRLKTEQRLKTGDLKAVVATASLELGIDVGYIDLVIQVGSPRSIATFLQRIGRSGHALGLIPKGRLIALTRDELLEAMALVQAIRAGRLDVTPVPIAPLDVLAQQIVAEVSTGEWSTDDLFNGFRRAEPYRTLRRSQFDQVIKFLSEGVTDTGGRIHTLLHHDHVHRRVRARPNARLTSINNGGAIPETDVIRVVVQPEGTVVGSVDEEFGVESMAGDVFLLGNTSWQIEGLRGSDLHVHDAHGAPPTIPFWRGEGPGRTLELSEEVSRLRREIEERVKQGGETREERQEPEDGVGRAFQPVPSAGSTTALPAASFGSQPSALDGLERPSYEATSGAGSHLSSLVPRLSQWLVETTSCTLPAAEQMVIYVAAQQAAIGLVPTQDRVIFERFFDETGGMQLVVHAPFGARINRGWGLAMRKRFCRSFDFELQATADDDGFILSLGPQHSFPIESLFPMLRADNVQNLLEQAILAVPMFQLRWRWNATRSLLVARMRNGKKVPPALQRFRSDDLLTAVFPRLTGCQENITGDHILPDHPLVEQTMYDCLNEALDIEGLLALLARVERGEIQFIARDTREPSPFSYELLNANPYAFLDGGEAQERRARAVQTRRSLSVNDVRDLGHLNPEAIAQVVAESQPVVRNADELHDVLLSRIVLPVSHDWESCFNELRDSGRAAEITLPNSQPAWVATERWPAARLVYKQAVCSPPLDVPPTVRQDWEEIEALVATIRGYVEFSGPVTASEIAAEMGLGESAVFACLEAIEGEGTVLRGRFRPDRRLGNPAYPLPEGEKSPRRHGGTEKEEVESSSAGRAHLPVPVDQPACSSTLTPSPSPGGLGEPEGGLSSPSVPPCLRGESSSSPAASAVPLTELGGLTPPRSPDPEIEWCHRRLLSRIHRLTVAGLRREIEPVEVPVFMRYLTRHQMLWPESRRSGSNAVYDVITQLQGLDIAAAAWESDILPLRIAEYKREWLDELSLTGEVTWGRLYPPARDPEKVRPNASLTRVAPVSICLREDLPWLLATAAETPMEALGSQAQEVVQILVQRGAVFATDLLQWCRMLPSQLDDVLGELVTRGWVTSDGFSGLRSLIRDGDRENGHSSGRGPKVVRHRRNSSVGRWTLWREETRDERRETRASMEVGRAQLSRSSTLTPNPSPGGRGEPEDKAAGSHLSSLVSRPSSTEQWAWQLLRRWGVVFRDLLSREPGAPRWWELLQVYRKLEARGEIRGGRFVSGVAGEQYALGDTIRELRQLKEQPGSGELLIISACDPLNLIGILGDVSRVPSLASNRIALFNGKPVGYFQGDVQLLPSCPKSLAPYISAQLRSGKTMAVAIPKAESARAVAAR